MTLNDDGLNLAASALSSILRAANAQNIPRTRIKIAELLQSTQSGSTPANIQLPAPTPLLGALLRLTKEKIKLVPIAIDTRTGPTPLPHINTKARRHSVILLPEDPVPLKNHSPHAPISGKKKEHAIVKIKKSSVDYKHSHKIAERKRRREMRDILDRLAHCLPASTVKRSKWETLVDAIDYLDTLETKKKTLINLIKQN